MSIPMDVPGALGRLVDLIETLEARLTGARPPPTRIESLVPMADSYILILFDGLGLDQLTHPSTRSLEEDRIGSLVSPFPSTTTVSLSTLATGAQPFQHGIIGHLMWLPPLESVVNTLKWVDITGRQTGFDTRPVLPSPNTWERLSAAGVEPITVQPAQYERSPLTRMLYRGCRFEGVHSIHELIAATIDLASRPGRLVFTYLPHVDVAAHMHGQQADEYAEAVRLADTVWSTVRSRLPSGVTVVGTADHGHVDYAPSDKVLIRDRRFDPLRFAGDPRSVFVWGDDPLIDDLVAETGAARHAPSAFRRLAADGRPDHSELVDRLPDAVLLAPPGRVLLPRGFDKRLIGYHGGLSRAEIEVPLLAATG